MRFNIWKLEDGKRTKILKKYDSDVELGVESFPYTFVAPFTEHVPETDEETAAREAAEIAQAQAAAARHERKKEIQRVRRSKLKDYKKQDLKQLTTNEVRDLLQELLKELFQEEEDYA